LQKIKKNHGTFFEEPLTTGERERARESGKNKINVRNLGRESPERKMKGLFLLPDFGWNEWLSLH